MLHGHPPNGRDDRPLVEPVRVSDVGSRPIDHTLDSKPLQDAAGVVGWHAGCDITKQNNVKDAVVEH